MNYDTVRASLYITSTLVFYIAVIMLIPAAVDIYNGDKHWKVFVKAAAFAGGVSSLIILATRGPIPAPNARFGFLVVNFVWVAVSLCGTIPLAISPIGLSLTDALFEAVSGVTTTGATIITNLDEMPKGILLWRALLQWIGGLGVIALGVFILPFLSVGGATFFKIESSDVTERPFEKFKDYAIALIAIYVLLTVACSIAYSFAGMTSFNAVAHALSTVSTAGYSTHDASMAVYANNPLVLWIAITFMLIGALPFVIIILSLKKHRVSVSSDPQIKLFFTYVAFFSLSVSTYLFYNENSGMFISFTKSTFNFVSIITTTGFSSEDYTAWGPFVVVAAFSAMFLGGCSGSTTGGIKSYRFLILYKMVIAGLRRLIYPNIAGSARYGGATLGDALQRNAILFIAAFFAVWLFGSLALGALGLDLTTALSAALTALTNVGPGIGDVVGPAGNFSSLPSPAKMILIALMLIGRLEILAVLVLATPTFWTR